MLQNSRVLRTKIPAKKRIKSIINSNTKPHFTFTKGFSFLEEVKLLRKQILAILKLDPNVPWLWYNAVSGYQKSICSCKKSNNLELQ